jgi:hypothetical protein
MSSNHTLKGFIMKIKLISIAMIAALSAGFNANAVNTEGASTNVERSEFKRGHKMKMRISTIVHNYMLEQGDITQGEIDILKAEHEANRAAIKTLKEAGDTEGLAAKKAELRTKREERRDAMKAYIDSHEELKTQLEEKRDEFRSKKRKHHHDRKERRQNNEDTTTEG